MAKVKAAPKTLVGTIQLQESADLIAWTAVVNTATSRTANLLARVTISENAFPSAGAGYRREWLVRLAVDAVSWITGVLDVAGTKYYRVSLMDPTGAWAAARRIKSTSPASKSGPRRCRSRAGSTPIRPAKAWSPG